MVHFRLDATTVDSGDPDAVEEAGGDTAANAVGRFNPRSTVRMGQPPKSPSPSRTPTSSTSTPAPPSGSNQRRHCRCRNPLPGGSAQRSGLRGVKRTVAILGSPTGAGSFTSSHIVSIPTNVNDRGCLRKSAWLGRNRRDSTEHRPHETPGRWASEGSSGTPGSPS